MVASALDLDDGRVKLGDHVLVLGGGAPDDDAAVGLERGDGVAAADDGDDIGLNGRGDLGDGAGGDIVRALYAAVVKKNDKRVHGERHILDVALHGSLDVKIDKVLVAPQEQLAVLGERGGELVGGEDLDYIHLVVAVIGLKVEGEVDLAEALVAPCVEGALLVERESVVGACGDLDDLGIPDLFGNVGNVDDLCDLALAPDIDVAVNVRADGVVGADGDVRDAVFDQRVGIVHHIVAGREIDERAVLLAEVERDVMRRHENKDGDDEEQYERDDRERLGEEVAQNDTAGTLKLLLGVDIGLGVGIEGSLYPAPEEELLPGGCAFLFIIHDTASFTYLCARAGQRECSSGR